MATDKKLEDIINRLQSMFVQDKNLNCSKDEQKLLLNNLDNFLNNRQETIRKTLNDWLNKRCETLYYNEEDIKFLLDCGADKRIIYNKIKDSMETLNINEFIFVSQKFMKLITKKEIAEYINSNKMLKKQLNDWLIYSLKNNYYWKVTNIKILLDCGADIETIYKEIRTSIDSSEFDTFKFLVKNFKEYGISLEEIKKEEQYKLKLDIELNNWLAEVSQYVADKDNINFLLKCGANEDIIYNKIKSLIEQPFLYKFQQFIEGFEEDEGYKEEYEVTIEKIRQYIKKQKKLQEQLNSWLKEVKDKKTRKLLIECGAEDITNDKDITKDVINKPKISAPYLFEISFFFYYEGIRFNR